MSHDRMKRAVRNAASAKTLLARLGLIAALVGSAACTKLLDMSGERIARPGPEWGVVIGSVLVQPEKIATGKKAAGRAVAASTYEFEIVQIQPGDPDGERPYVERYRLDAQAGEERIFISRLRTGQYLIKNFRDEGVTGLGGDLGLIFTSLGGEVRYVGRVLVEVPQSVSSGKGYRFTVENAREPTLAEVARRHAGLTKDVVSVPMQAREGSVP